MRHSVRIFTFLLSGVIAQCSFAGVVLSAAAVISNSATSYPGYDIVDTINQNGLFDPNRYVSGVTDFDSYIGSKPLHSPGQLREWFALAPTHTAAIVYDMGAVYEITRIAFWNEEFSGATGFQFFVCAAADCVFRTALGTFAIVDSPRPNPATNDYYLPQVLDSTNAYGRYFMGIVTGPNSPNEYDAVSMGEIAFEATAAPEPATLLPVIAAGLWLFSRRATISFVRQGRRRVRAKGQAHHC